MSLIGAVAYILFSQLLFFLGTPAGFIPCIVCLVPLGVLVGWIVQRGNRHDGFVSIVSNRTDEFVRE